MSAVQGRREWTVGGEGGVLLVPNVLTLIQAILKNGKELPVLLAAWLTAAPEPRIKGYRDGLGSPPSPRLHFTSFLTRPPSSC